jgi:tetratricopeptide (TPR) repeat protein
MSAKTIKRKMERRLVKEMSSRVDRLLAQNQPTAALEEIDKCLEDLMNIPGKRRRREVLSNSNPDLWSDDELQHNLRAIYADAKILRDEENYDEAIELWYQLLCFDETDELHAVRLLVPTLIELNRLDSAHLLLDAFHDDCSAHMMYSRALYLFKRQGASEDANEALLKGLNQNMHVIEMLREQKRPIDTPEIYQSGSLEEAQNYLKTAMRDWYKREDIVNWFMNFEREKVQKLKVVKAFPNLKLVN